MQTWSRSASRGPSRAVYLAALASFGVGSTAGAARYSWNGNNSGNWSNPLNWNGAVPVSSSDTVLEFRTTGATGAAVSNNDLASPFTLWFLEGPVRSTRNTTLTGGPLRFVVNPNQTTFPFALIWNASDATYPGAFIINNDIIVDARELHLSGGRAPGSLILKGALTGSGRIFSRGIDAVYDGVAPEFTGILESASGILTLGPNARVGPGARVIASGDFQDGRLVVTSASNLTRDGQVEVTPGGFVQPKTLDSQMIKRIWPKSSGALVVAPDTVVADTLDLSGHPRLSIGVHSPDIAGVVTFASSITPANDTYRFGGSTARSAPYQFYQTLDVASRLTDAPDGTPRGVELLADGPVYGGKVKLSNQSNSYSGGTVVGRLSSAPVLLTFDYSPAPGETPLGTGPLVVHGGLMFVNEGTAGSIPNPISFRPGSRLVLDNIKLVSFSPDTFQATYEPMPRDRWPDAKPLDLNGTTVQVRTAGASLFTEKVGAISFGGDSGIEFETRHATRAATLHADALARRGRGTLVVSRPQYSTNVSGFLKVGDASAVTDPATGMLHPSIVRDTSLADRALPTFLRRDAEGVLRAVSYVSSFNAASDSEIVEPWSKFLSTDETAYAVNTRALTIAPGKTLTIRSGGLIFSDYQENTITGGAIAFADGLRPVEGVVYTSSYGDAEIGSAITAADGITFFGGASSVTLSAANTFTGPLTIHGGDVTLDHPNALPAGTAVHIDQGRLIMNHSITLPALSGSGSIAAGEARVTLTVDAASDLTYDGSLVDRPAFDQVLSLVKTGPAALTLTGVNGRRMSEPVTGEPFAMGGYSGLTTVEHGTLNLRETFLRYGGYTTHAGAVLNIYTDHAIVALDGEGATTIADGAVVTSDHVRQGSLRLESKSKLNIRPAQANPLRSEFAQLTIAPDATFDPADSDLLVHADAASREQVLADVTGHIRSARNAPQGAWKGPGLTSSAAASDPLTTLAVGLVGDDIFVKYTYNGDANLDGRINADDYFRIDSGFLEQPAAPLFADGDFNYDGRINADDYFLIDSAFLGQGASLEGAGLAAVAVPEPAGAVLGVLGGLLAMRRRR